MENAWDNAGCRTPVFLVDAPVTDVAVLQEWHACKHHTPRHIHCHRKRQRATSLLQIDWKCAFVSVISGFRAEEVAPGEVSREVGSLKFSVEVRMRLRASLLT